jgi:hypothetical protein
MSSLYAALPCPRTVLLVVALAVVGCSADAGTDPLAPPAPTLSVDAIGAAARAAGRATELPFRGVMHAVETGPFSVPSTPLSRNVGTGTATHLGRFTWYSEFTIDLAAGTGSGVATLTAANGDKVFTTLTGSGVAVEGGFAVVEPHTITGGTGRFAGATGSFVIERSVVLATGTTSGSFDGTISLGK